MIRQLTERRRTKFLLTLLIAIVYVNVLATLRIPI